MAQKGISLVVFSRILMAIPATSKHFRLWFSHFTSHCVYRFCFAVVPPIIMQSLERNFTVVKVNCSWLILSEYYVLWPLKISVTIEITSHECLPTSVTCWTMVSFDQWHCRMYFTFWWFIVLQSYVYHTYRLCSISSKKVHTHIRTHTNKQTEI